MKISEIITDRYKLRIPPTVYYDLLADVQEAEEEQEQKTGHWIDTNDDGFVYHKIYKCSHCGATVCEYPQNMHESKYKYCSSCGAKMVEPQESEDKA